jgi:hypothetical protein
MTARSIGAVPRHREPNPKDGGSGRLRWVAAVAAAILFLILAGLMNGIAYWKLSEEQQHLALSLSAVGPATHHLLTRYHPRAGKHTMSPALKPPTRAPRSH